MIEILKSSEWPSWVTCPELYLKLIKNGEHKFLPWYLYDRESMLIRFEGLKKRYPNRKLFCFARTDDSDDIACWEENKLGKVVIIHDYASPGWEQRQIFDSFEDWYQFALSERWAEEND